uniref:TGS domain-containing protein n=1 Tax=Candidatus Kentrum sp. TUN TaxID=2126343 RepID=A0A450ZSA4_9GAMM|nr:MAG: Protein of unknown function (DUF933) [Candidatus Kentron sp. TUN]VFK55291.1 MAG: Protein of unknown function (DUF933) [Candidatus Kentron sp. TUN]VFK56658.1 MAG: Protein of unknown function (DUF933) [Candidatus Kentron sp. TUN]
MRIATTGINLSEGKVKYEDTIVLDLADKFLPKKITPYYFEFLHDDYESGNIIVITRDRILDLLIHDIEKVETRRDRTTDSDERVVLDRVLNDLEREIPVCALQFGEHEEPYIRALSPLSFKPTLVLDVESDDANTLVANEIISQAMAVANLMFFYTAGKKEVRAWLVYRGTSAQGCAGKIHSDLAQGFVKAEIIPADDLLECHNMQDARQRNLTRLVDRDFIIPENTVLEIRFNI